MVGGVCAYLFVSEFVLKDAHGGVGATGVSLAYCDRWSF